MTTLTIQLGGMDDIRRRLMQASSNADAGEPVEVQPSLNFASYEDMHRILAPSRITIIRAMAGQGPVSIREVARRVGRDIQAVHRDVTTLINAGVIERNANGIEFPYQNIHFDFDVSAAA